MTGCGDDTSANDGAGGSGNAASGGGGGTAGGGGGGGGPGAGCTEPTEVSCSDAVFLNMNLQDDITPGLVNSTADGAGFTSTIDATAGGAFTADPTSFTYVKFADAGLQKVELNDEDSLGSMDWDLALRRYVVRINSGNSGPSCVTAARVPPGTTYDALTEEPADLAYRVDEYFTPSPDCTIIPDGSGLENSPATALSSFWTYPGCVQMTDNVFVVGLADGRRVKLTFSSYYEPAIQEQCDTAGTIPMGDTGAGNYVIRWAYLP